jgi:hypothetical protein
MKFTYPRELSFAHPDYEVGCAGTETPFIGFTGQTFLFVWHKERKEHYYYCFEEDMFWGEKEYNELENKAFNPNP